MSEPNNEQQSIRWIPCKDNRPINSGDGLVNSRLPIPPYALMAIRFWGSNARAFRTEKQIEEGILGDFGQPLMGISFPTAFHEQSQIPALLVFNGPYEIAPGGTGFCTQDWPARVLFDGSALRPGASGSDADGGRQIIYPGQTFGPKERSWYADPAGWAFACQGHVEDAETGLAFIQTRVPPSSNPTPQTLHTIYGSPAGALPAAFSAVRWLAAGDFGGVVTSQPNSYLDWNGVSGGSIIGQRGIDAIKFSTGVSMPNGAMDAWKIVRPGLYRLSFSATAWTTTKFDSIVIQAKHTGTYSTGLGQCAREQLIDLGDYDHVRQVAKENIAMVVTFPYCQAGDLIRLYNASSSETFLSSMMAELHWAGPYDIRELNSYDRGPSGSNALAGDY